jgi:hypothetical protein
MERSDSKTIQGLTPEESALGCYSGFEAGRLVKLAGTRYEVDIIVAALSVLCGDLFQRRVVKIASGPVDIARVSELLKDISQPNYAKTAILPPSGTWPE